MSKEQSTIVVYEISGSTRRFPVPFEYLSRQFVVVTLLGAGRTVLTLGSDYRFISLNEIETTVAYGGADGNLFIEIRRVTSATDRLVEFSDGSVLRSRDMNVSAIQTIHIAEEARNLASDTLASDDDGNLDARGRRLVNLGDAVNPKDAMTYEQVTGWSQSALNQANRSQLEANKSAARAAAALVSQNAAAASQSAAKSSETAAKTSETASKSSETKAKTSETKAKTSETKAKTSETIALQQAQSATTKAGEAALSASNALSSKGLAQKWAENPVNVPVANGGFSAKHWAQQAKGFAGGDNYLQVLNNLSDIPDKSLAIRNLGLDTAIAKKADQTALNATNMKVTKKQDASTMVALAHMHADAPERTIRAPAGTDTYMFFNKSSFGLFSPTKGALFIVNCVTGAVWGKATGSFTDVEVRSDIRDKIDLKDISSPLERVENLKGYTYKLLTSEGSKESAGVIAQDVLKVLPVAVGTSTNHNEEERYTVNYNSLTALLVEAVKELSAEVKYLKEVIHNGS